jgi:hypothetical protein
MKTFAIVWIDHFNDSMMGTLLANLQLNNTNDEINCVHHVNPF